VGRNINFGIFTGSYPLWTTYLTMSYAFTRQLIGFMYFSEFLSE